MVRLLLDDRFLLDRSKEERATINQSTAQLSIISFFLRDAENLLQHHLFLIRAQDARPDAIPASTVLQEQLIVITRTPMPMTPLTKLEIDVFLVAFLF